MASGKCSSGGRGDKTSRSTPLGMIFDPATWKATPHEILRSTVGDRDGWHGSENSGHRPLEEPRRCRHREGRLLKCCTAEKVMNNQGHRCSDPPKGRKKRHLVEVLHHNVEPFGPESASEVQRGGERKRVPATDPMHLDTVERTARRSHPGHAEHKSVTECPHSTSRRKISRR